MKIYIQSKSGKYNSVASVLDTENPFRSDRVREKEKLFEAILRAFRESGGYFITTNRDKIDMFIPFEEIEYIREATKDDIV